MDIVINADIDEVPEGHFPILNQGNFYHNILTCLGYSYEKPPVADLLRRYHGLEGQWLIASPIHWQATHNDAMIVASGSELQLSDQVSRLWFAAFKEFVTADHFNVHYHDAHTWLIQCDGKPLLDSKPVHTLHHKSLMPELRKLDETLYWQRLITEGQMFFSEHPLNKDRLASYSINGLWFWGGGQLQERVQKQLVACADDSLLRLARLLSMNVSSSFTSITKSSVLLFDNMVKVERSVLQIKFQKYAPSWYWNNIAYTIPKPRNWFSRLVLWFIEAWATI